LARDEFHARVREAFGQYRESLLPSVRVTAIFVVAVIVFFGALFIHDPQVARLAPKQTAIAEAKSDAQPTKIAVKEWEVPTSNSHPHDPAVAPDGALWYTGKCPIRSVAWIP
jgi:hypothetical protein